jgi:malonate transporter
MYMAISSAMIPVFFVISLGYFAGKRGIIDNSNIKSLNMFLMMFALPAALFSAIAPTPRDAIIQNAPLAAVLAISMLGIFIVTAVIEYRVFRLDQAEGAVQTLTIAFPNFAAMGLPLMIGVYGRQAALPVAMAIATGSVTISPLALALLELSKSKGQDGGPKAAQFLRALRKSVSKPIFIAPLVAVIVALSGFQMPALADKSLMLIGEATAGCGLFLTGLILSAQPIRISRNVVQGVCMKNIIQPLLTAGVVWLLRVPQPMAGEVVLLIAIPTGYFGLVFGAEYGFRPAVAGSTLLISSALSVITLVVTIALVAPK